MDRTGEFACAVATKRMDEELKTPPEEILRPVKHPNLFLRSARMVLLDVERVRRYLADNRSAYVNAHKYLNAAVSLTDAERDQIDDEATTAITTCTAEIDRLKDHVLKVAGSNSENSQMQQHLNGIVMFLYEDLSDVHDSFGRQKAARFKNAVADLRANFPSVSDDSYMMVDTGESEEALGLDLSEVERAELNQQTQALYRTLGDELDMVRQIEKQVVAISSLQQQLSLKVLEQQEAIDHLERITVESVALVESGVEQLRQAQRSVSDYRLIVLATLLIFSFTLLFLHWYT